MKLRSIAAAVTYLGWLTTLTTTSGCKPPGGRDYGTIVGHVVDQSSGAGVGGARIMTSDRTVNTDGNGNYTITQTKAGSTVVTVTRDGYATAVKTVQVDKNAESRADFELKSMATTGTLDGHVTDSASGPLAGVTVSTPAGSTQTDASGYFVFTGHPAGAFQVRASKSGYTDATASTSVSVNATTTVNLQLSSLSTVKQESEPNDDPLHANPIEPNDVIQGSTGNGTTTQDYFVIQAPVNGLVRVTVVNREPAGTASAAIGKVRMLDHLSQELASNGSYTTPGQQDVIPPVVVSAGQPLYVEVNRNGANVARYELRVQFTPEAVAEAFEPNDDPAHAAPAPGTVLQALIGYSDDAEDWYEVTATGTLLTIKVRNLHPAGVANGGLGRVSVVDPATGTELASNGSYTQPNVEDSLKPVSVTTGTKYRVRVLRLNAKSAAPYRISVIQ